VRRDARLVVVLRDGEPEELIACWTLVEDDWRIEEAEPGIFTD
jgi:hypothetical protein